MANERVLSLRLDQGVGEELDLIAAIDGETVSDVLRRALLAHIGGRKSDPKFRTSVDQYLARQRRILLGGETDG